MSGFSSFTFGVPNYFSFTFSFQVGRPSHDPVAFVPQALEKTTENKPQKTYTKPAIEATFKSSRNAVTQPTTELFREPAFHIATKSTAAAAIKTKEEATFSKLSIGLQKPSMAAATMTAKGPMLPKSSVELQKRCPLLYAIPPEIRCMIYSHLLVSADPINSEQANKLIGDKRSVLLSDHNPISGISATLLRTCRKVYNEALPILYGRNVFIFSRPKAIDNFRDSGIDGFTRACDFRKREPQGRLTLLCCVVLKFLPEKTSGGGLWDIPPDPKEPWKIWTRDFLNSRLYDLRFPALRELTLDFLELKLDENIGFRVEPFVRRLAPSNGLQKLVIRGLKHEETLEALRAGLVRKDGNFVVENPSK